MSLCYGLCGLTLFIDRWRAGQLLAAAPTAFITHGEWGIGRVNDDRRFSWLLSLAVLTLIEPQLPFKWAAEGRVTNRVVKNQAEILQFDTLPGGAPGQPCSRRGALFGYLTRRRTLRANPERTPIGKISVLKGLQGFTHKYSAAIHLYMT